MDFACSTFIDLICFCDTLQWNDQKSLLPGERERERERERKLISYSWCKRYKSESINFFSFAHLDSWIDCLWVWRSSSSWILDILSLESRKLLQKIVAVFFFQNSTLIDFIWFHYTLQSNLPSSSIARRSIATKIRMRVEKTWMSWDCVIESNSQSGFNTRD
jgi:hypothetical protein